MESTVHDLFTRYEQAFTLALAGTIRMDDIATLYASDFIAASPSGVMSGKNDGRFRQAMAQGYERYRDIGTKAMRIRQVAVSCIDEHHCIAWPGPPHMRDLTCRRRRSISTSITLCRC